MKNRLDRRIVIGLIIFGAIFRLVMLIMIPEYPEVFILPSYNDEPLHLHYIEYVADEMRIPVYKATGIDSIDHIRGEFGQTPLYYILSAPMYKLCELIHDGWGLYGARLMSIAFGILAAYFAYLMALAFSRSKIIAVNVLVAMLMAPNAAVFTTLVTNDSLLVCTAALAMYNIVRCRCGDQTILRQVLARVFLGLSVWTKLSGILLFPIIWYAADPKARLGAQWLTRTRITIFALIILIPLAMTSQNNLGHVLPGHGVEMQMEYQPEQAVGVTGGAFFHPIKAMSIFLRTIPQPFMELWGSALEKITTICWLLFWGLMTILGIIQALTEHPKGTMFVAAVLMLTAGFIYWGFFTFQVEFRHFTPAFPALAFITALGMERLKISPATQAIAWSLPLLIVPCL